MCGRYNNHRQAMEKWAEILNGWPTDEERQDARRNLPISQGFKSAVKGFAFDDFEHDATVAYGQQL